MKYFMLTLDYNIKLIRNSSRYTLKKHGKVWKHRTCNSESYVFSFSKDKPIAIALAVNVYLRKNWVPAVFTHLRKISLIFYLFTDLVNKFYSF